VLAVFDVGGVLCLLDFVWTIISLNSLTEFFFGGSKISASR